MQITQLKDTLISHRERLKTLTAQAEEKRILINQLFREHKNSEEALLILQHVAKKTQGELEYQISEIVTLAIAAVFEDPYEFKIEFVVKRNKTEAEVYLFRDGHRYDIIHDNGVGIVDVVAFALRIALWNLSRPKSRNCIILDEPFKNLDKTRQPKAGLMLKEISKKLGIQFLIVTHENFLKEAADRIIHVELVNKVSQISIIK